MPHVATVTAAELDLIDAALAGAHRTDPGAGYDTVQTTVTRWRNTSTDDVLATITFRTADITYLAEEAGVPDDVALERAQEWAKAIAETATELMNRQFASVVDTGQP